MIDALLKDQREAIRQMASAYLRRREAALQAFMAAHPRLTREQALVLMEAEGF